MELVYVSITIAIISVIAATYNLVEDDILKYKSKDEKKDIKKIVNISTIIVSSLSGLYITYITIKTVKKVK